MDILNLPKVPKTGDSVEPQEQFTADEANQIFTEVIKAITSSGITKSSVDLAQIPQAMARYASGGVHHEDSGAANAYVLASPSGPSGFVMPKSYFTGMAVRFAPGTTNTGSSVVNINGIGSKKLMAWHGGEVLPGDLVAGKMIDIAYDPAANGGGGAFLLLPWASLDVSGAAFANNVQIYEAGGAFTVPAGVSVIFAELWSAGGAGGGTANNACGGAGGSAGGYARKRIDVTPAEVIAITVGVGGVPGAGYAGYPGGATSVGAYVSANGGGGGNVGSQAAPGLPVQGSGGIGVGGDLDLRGGYGDQGGGPANNWYSLGGRGGAAPLGGSGGAQKTGDGLAGVSPGGAGSGGGGFTGSSTSGGAGANGLVIIKWSD